MEYIYLDALRHVYKALEIKGYSPANQILGYILSGDPTYITNYENARQIILKIDRYDLLKEMASKYLQKLTADKIKAKQTTGSDSTQIQYSNRTNNAQGMGNN